MGWTGTDVSCGRLRAMKAYGSFYYTFAVTAQISLTTYSLKTSFQELVDRLDLGTENLYLPK